MTANQLDLYCVSPEDGHNNFFRAQNNLFTIDWMSLTSRTIQFGIGIKANNNIKINSTIFNHVSIANFQS